MKIKVLQIASTLILLTGLLALAANGYLFSFEQYRATHPHSVYVQLIISGIVFIIGLIGVIIAGVKRVD